MSHPLPPPALAGELRRLTTHELSWPSRLRYLALLLASATMAAVTAALLVTERGLPARTVAALAVLTLIGLAWVAFSSWVLTSRRPLLGRHRIVAARLSVAFCGLFAVGASWVGIATGAGAAYVAAALGVVMVGVAVALLVRANRRFAALAERRSELAGRMR